MYGLTEAAVHELNKENQQGNGHIVTKMRLHTKGPLHRKKVFLEILEGFDDKLQEPQGDILHYIICL